MGLSPLPDFVAALFTAVLIMDAEAAPLADGEPIGISHYGKYRHPDQTDPPTELSWTQRLEELLEAVNFSVRNECKYPDFAEGSSACVCDNVVTFADEGILWLEIKGAWKSDWAAEGNPAKFRWHLLTSSDSAAHDIQKLAMLRPPTASYIGQLLIGFDTDADPIARDVREYCDVTGVSTGSWKVSSLHIPDRWRPGHNIHVWFFWRPSGPALAAPTLAAPAFPAPIPDVASYNLEPEHGLDPQFRETIESLEVQADIDPGNAVIRYNMGVEYGLAGLVSDAIVEYRLAIELNPDYTPAHYNLASTYLELGLAQEARIEFEHVIRLAPAMSRAFFMLATTYGALGLPEKMIEVTKLGLGIAPDAAQGMCNMGTACNRLGRFGEAVQFLARAVASDPENATAYLEIGKAHRGLGNVREEFDAYRRAIEIRGDFIDAWLFLGAAYMKIRRGDQRVVSYLEIQGKLDPSNPQQMFYFSLGLLALEMVDEAKGHLRRMKETAPKLAAELQAFIAEAQRPAR